MRRLEGKLRVQGITHENGDVTTIAVNGLQATVLSRQSGVVAWEVVLEMPADRTVSACAHDGAANVETRAHLWKFRNDR